MESHLPELHLKALDGRWETGIFSTMKKGFIALYSYSDLISLAGIKPLQKNKVIPLTGIKY